MTIFTHAVSGFVYHDANNDGVKDTGETPLGGVPIRLQGTDHLGNTVDITLNTQPDGSYSFTGLRPSNAAGYTLTETTQPSGYLDGKETSGTPWAGTVNNMTDSQSISAVVMPTGTASTVGVNYNFGEIQPNSLAGVVYNDVNNNDVYNAGTDRGIFGATVTLTGTDDRGNTVNIPVTTAAAGSYSFANLRPGTYILTETQPDGYTDSTDTVGSTGGTLGNDIVSDITLTQNQDGTGYNFGEVGPGSIGDTIFLDLDNNGSPDPGEGIGGVTVQLQGDLNGDGVVDTIMTVTGPNGQYLFDHLPAPTGGRTYTVTVLSGIASGLTVTVDPEGAMDGVSTATLTAANPTNLAQDFGYRGTGQIGDTVFADSNNNGTPDAGEGIPNITVTLVGDFDGDGSDETVTTTTGANGEYLFSGLRTTVAGVNYAVTVDTADPQFPPGLSVNHVDPDSGGDSTSAVSLTDTAASRLDQDFGYRGTGQIGDTVFADSNNNGTPDAGEGIPNITVTLVGDFDGDGSDETVTTTTGANGEYLFSGLRTTVAGVNYAVTVDTADPQFPPGLSVNHVDPDSGGDSTSAVSLTDTAASRLDQDFGYRGTGQIGDTVFADSNNNGTPDAGEGIPNITVTLVGDFDGDGSDETVTTTTGANGEYLFSGLRTTVAGVNYAVTVDTADPQFPPGLSVNHVDPDSGGDSTSAVSLTDTAASRLDQDFGYRGTGQIGDTVFADSNNNGTPDAGEGIPNITVTLVGDFDGDGSDETVTTTTGANGEYLFSGLRTTVAGVNYAVTVDTADPQFPPGLSVNHVDPDSGGDSTSAVSLTDTAASRLDQDFGYRGTGQIGDTVFADSNNNGTPDAGEGIPNITVTLVGDFDGDGSDETVTTTTGANGEYLFSGLRTTVAGVNYAVTVDTADPQFPPGLSVNHVDPDSGGDSTSAVSLTDTAASRLDQDFGYRGTGQIGDTVFADSNNNGTPDAGEGIPNITVTLVGDFDGDGSDETVTTTTGANGEYLFSGLRTTVAGVNYAVTVDTADPHSRRAGASIMWTRTAAATARRRLV